MQSTAVCRRRFGQPRPRALTAALVVSLGLGGVRAQTAADDESPLIVVKSALEQWMEVEQDAAEARAKWRLGKQLLNDQIELAKTEVASFQQRIQEHEAKIGENGEEIAEREQELERLREAQEVLVGIVADLEARVLRILPRLPQPLRTKAEPISQQIPPDANGEKAQSLGVARRLQNVVGVLNQINRFNHEINVSSEVLTLENGANVEVTTLYLGIGQGYYVSANSDFAGIGTATADGWTWRPANDAAVQIAKAVAIYEGRDLAEFVPLPIQIN